MRDSEKYCVPTSSRRLERTSSEPASSMGCTIFTLNCSALADNEPRNAVKCDAAHCRYCCDPTIADPTVTTPRVLHAPVATSQYRHIIGVCKPANSTAVRTKAITVTVLLPVLLLCITGTCLTHLQARHTTAAARTRVADRTHSNPKVHRQRARHRRIHRVVQHGVHTSDTVPHCQLKHSRRGGVGER